MGSYSTLVVCHIFNGNSFVSATNDSKTSPKYYRKFADGNESYAGHAEMRAISKVPKSWDTSKLKVYVQRFKKDGSVGMSKPCVHCQAALWRAGIISRRVWFTTDEGAVERFTPAEE